jgi:hypothetical protein
MEEARHLAYARTTVGEHWQHATWTDRFAVRWIAPIAIVTMFDTIVQPFVYPTVGLPALRTWLRVRRQPARVALRQECVRSVLRALMDADVFPSGGVPLLWRHTAAVDHDGVPRARRSRRSDSGTALVTTSAAHASRRAWSTACSVARPLRTVALDAQDRVTTAASTCWRLSAWIRL